MLPYVDIHDALDALDAWLQRRVSPDDRRMRVVVLIEVVTSHCIPLPSGKHPFDLCEPSKHVPSDADLLRLVSYLEEPNVGGPSFFEGCPFACIALVVAAIHTARCGDGFVVLGEDAGAEMNWGFYPQFVQSMMENLAA